MDDVDRSINHTSVWIMIPAAVDPLITGVWIVIPLVRQLFTYQ